MHMVDCKFYVPRSESMQVNRSTCLKPSDDLEINVTESALLLRELFELCGFVIL